MLKIEHRLTAGSRPRQLMHLRKWTTKTTASQPEPCMGKTTFHLTRPPATAKEPRKSKRWDLCHTLSDGRGHHGLLGVHPCGMRCRSCLASVNASLGCFHASYSFTHYDVRSLSCNQPPESWDMWRRVHWQWEAVFGLESSYWLFHVCISMSQTTTVSAGILFATTTESSAKKLCRATVTATPDPVVTSLPCRPVYTWIFGKYSNEPPLLSCKTSALKRRGLSQGRRMSVPLRRHARPALENWNVRWTGMSANKTYDGG